MKNMLVLNVVTRWRVHGPFLFPHAKVVPKRNNRGSLGIMNLEHADFSTAHHHIFKVYGKTKLLVASCSNKCFFFNHHHPSPPPLHYRRKVTSPVGQFRRRELVISLKLP